LKSTETSQVLSETPGIAPNFSNFGSLKSTETQMMNAIPGTIYHFSNFGSLKSTETRRTTRRLRKRSAISAISAR